MNKVRQIFQRVPEKVVIASLLTLVLIAGLASLVVNRGFRFTYYNASRVLTFDAEVDEAVIDRFSGAAYVSQVDRQQRSVRFQDIDGVQFNQIYEGLVDELGEDAVSQSETRLVMPVDLVLRIAASAFAALVIILAFLYYTSLRKLWGYSRRNLLVSVWLYVLALGTGLLMHLGILSIISSFYELKAVSFAGVMLSGVWAGVLLFMVYRFAEEKRPSSLQDLGDFIRRNDTPIARLNRQFLAILVVMLVFLTIGMGIRFGMDAFGWWLGSAATLLTIRYFPRGVLYISRTISERQSGQRAKALRQAHSAEISRPEGTRSEVRQAAYRRPKKKKPRR